ncbi:quinone oxidoreductase [Galactobacter valiniphilus]|uniref:Quinone oxidoreductase n=1 Tax=Galactobacter valiniphilus TaxID=2676122 RepID=A0A399JBA5_9MICC|nr:quinone oxidoreductase [Galactobacter valiniphilus]RII41509.1 quinone oxidoreductase [Galactobacter valiniphilus]
MPEYQDRIRIDRYGSPEELRLVQDPVPQPGPGELLVKVAAVGVNFIETYQRSGVYRVPLPFRPGSEASGTVTAIGEGVTGFAVGDLVATAEGSGTYAEYTLLDAQRAVKVPGGVDPVEAAAVPLQGFTAHYLINDSYQVKAGDTILTTAGAGGVGQLLTQMLKAKGATVITTTSTPAKAAIAAEAGADHVLRYDEVPGAVRELTDGVGVAAVYDGVGAATFESSLLSLRPRGTMVLFGGASGQVPPFDLQRLNALGSLSITRPSLSAFLSSPAERAWRAGEVFGAVASGELQLSIGERFSLRHADDAHRALEGRGTTGKVLLVP